MIKSSLTLFICGALATIAAGARADCKSDWFPPPGSVREVLAHAYDSDHSLKFETLMREEILGGNGNQFTYTTEQKSKDETFDRTTELLTCVEGGLKPADTEDEDGVKEVRGGLSFPDELTPGQVFRATETHGDDPGPTTTYRVRGIEKVKAGGVEYDAWRIDYSSPEIAKGTQWRVRGVGYVKQVEDRADGRMELELQRVQRAAWPPDCATQWFPKAGRKLKFRQVDTATIDGTKHTRTLETVQEVVGTESLDLIVHSTHSIEDAEPSEEELTYLCMPDGLQPVGQTSSYSRTSFTGVQYANKLAPGRTWTFGFEQAGDGWTASSKADYTVVKKETIHVPAGTMKAWRIDYTSMYHSSQRGDIGPTKGSLWVADGVGIVRQVEDDPGVGLVATHTVMELMEQ